VIEERFSSSSAYQYYQPLLHLGHTQTIMRYLSSCAGQDCTPLDNILDPLGSLSSFDIDFDTISHAVTFATHHSAPLGSSSGESQSDYGLVRKVRSSDTIEVGVLQSEKPDEDEPESLKLGGYLTILGEDIDPGKLIHHHPCAV